jgi:hypothetical protein
MASPESMPFCVPAALDFLAEIFPFSTGIETRNILSRIPPWAAI